MDLLQFLQDITKDRKIKRPSVRLKSQKVPLPQLSDKKFRANIEELKYFIRNDDFRLTTLGKRGGEHAAGHAIQALAEVLDAAWFNNQHQVIPEIVDLFERICSKYPGVITLAPEYADYFIGRHVIDFLDNAMELNAWHNANIKLPKYIMDAMEHHNPEWYLRTMWWQFKGLEGKKPSAELLAKLRESDWFEWIQSNVIGTGDISNMTGEQVAEWMEKMSAVMRKSIKQGILLDLQREWSRIRANWPTDIPPGQFTAPVTDDVEEFKKALQELKDAKTRAEQKAADVPNNTVERNKTGDASPKSPDAKKPEPIPTGKQKWKYSGGDVDDLSDFSGTRYPEPTYFKTDTAGNFFVRGRYFPDKREIDMSYRTVNHETGVRSSKLVGRYEYKNMCAAFPDALHISATWIQDNAAQFRYFLENGLSKEYAEELIAKGLITREEADAFIGRVLTQQEAGALTWDALQARKNGFKKLTVTVNIFGEDWDIKAVHSKIDGTDPWEEAVKKKPIIKKIPKTELSKPTEPPTTSPDRPFDGPRPDGGNTPTPNSPQPPKDGPPPPPPPKSGGGDGPRNLDPNFEFKNADEFWAEIDKIIDRRDKFYYELWSQEPKLRVHGVLGEPSKVAYGFGTQYGGLGQDVTSACVSINTRDRIFEMAKQVSALYAGKESDLQKILTRAYELGLISDIELDTVKKLLHGSHGFTFPHSIGGLRHFIGNAGNACGFRDIAEFTEQSVLDRLVHPGFKFQKGTLPTDIHPNCKTWKDVVSYLDTGDASSIRPTVISDINLNGDDLVDLSLNEQEQKALRDLLKTPDGEKTVLRLLEGRNTPTARAFIKDHAPHLLGRLGPEISGEAYERKVVTGIADEALGDVVREAIRIKSNYLKRAPDTHVIFDEKLSAFHERVFVEGRTYLVEVDAKTYVDRFGVSAAATDELEAVMRAGDNVTAIPYVDVIGDGKGGVSLNLVEGNTRMSAAAKTGKKIDVAVQSEDDAEALLRVLHDGEVPAGKIHYHAQPGPLAKKQFTKIIGAITPADNIVAKRTVAEMIAKLNHDIPLEEILKRIHVPEGYANWTHYAYDLSVAAKQNIPLDKMLDYKHLSKGYKGGQRGFLAFGTFSDLLRAHRQVLTSKQIIRQDLQYLRRFFISSKRVTTIVNAFGWFALAYEFIGNNVEDIQALDKEMALYMANPELRKKLLRLKHQMELEYPITIPVVQDKNLEILWTAAMQDQETRREVFCHIYELINMYVDWLYEIDNSVREKYYADLLSNPQTSLEVRTKVEQRTQPWEQMISTWDIHKDSGNRRWEIVFAIRRLAWLRDTINKVSPAEIDKLVIWLEQQIYGSPLSEDAIENSAGDAHLFRRVFGADISKYSPDEICRIHTTLMMLRAGRNLVTEPISDGMLFGMYKTNYPIIRDWVYSRLDKEQARALMKKIAVNGLDVLGMAIATALASSPIGWVLLTLAAIITAIDIWMNAEARDSDKINDAELRMPEMEGSILDSIVTELAKVYDGIDSEAVEDAFQDILDDKGNWSYDIYFLNDETVSRFNKWYKQGPLHGGWILNPFKAGGYKWHPDSIPAFMFLTHKRERRARKLLSIYRGFDVIQFPDEPTGVDGITDIDEKRKRAKEEFIKLRDAEVKARIRFFAAVGKKDKQATMQALRDIDAEAYTEEAYRAWYKQKRAVEMAKEQAEVAGESFELIAKKLNEVINNPETTEEERHEAQMMRDYVMQRLRELGFKVETAQQPVPDKKNPVVGNVAAETTSEKPSVLTDERQGKEKNVVVGSDMVDIPEDKQGSNLLQDRLKMGPGRNAISNEEVMELKQMARAGNAEAKAELEKYGLWTPDAQPEGTQNKSDDETKFDISTLGLPALMGLLERAKAGEVGAAQTLRQYGIEPPKSLLPQSPTTKIMFAGRDNDRDLVEKHDIRGDDGHYDYGYFDRLRDRAKRGHGPSVEELKDFGLARTETAEKPEQRPLTGKALEDKLKENAAARKAIEEKEKAERKAALEKQQAALEKRVKELWKNEKDLMVPQFKKLDKEAELLNKEIEKIIGEYKGLQFDTATDAEFERRQRISNKLESARTAANEVEGVRKYYGQNSPAAAARGDAAQQINNAYGDVISESLSSNPIEPEMSLSDDERQYVEDEFDSSARKAYKSTSKMKPSKENNAANNREWSDKNAKNMERAREDKADAEYKLKNAKTPEEYSAAKQQLDEANGALAAWEASMYDKEGGSYTAYAEAQEKSDKSSAEYASYNKGGYMHDVREEARATGQWTAEDERIFDEEKDEAREQAIYDERVANEEYRQWYQNGGREEIDRQEEDLNRKRYNSGPANNKPDKKGNGHSYGCVCAACKEEKENADERLSEEEEAKKAAEQAAEEERKREEEENLKKLEEALAKLKEEEEALKEKLEEHEDNIEETEEELKERVKKKAESEGIVFEDSSDDVNDDKKRGANNADAAANDTLGVLPGSNPWTPDWLGGGHLDPGLRGTSPNEDVSPEVNDEAPMWSNPWEPDWLGGGHLDPGISSTGTLPTSTGTVIIPTGEGTIAGREAGVINGSIGRENMNGGNNGNPNFNEGIQAIPIQMPSSGLPGSGVGPEPSGTSPGSGVLPPDYNIVKPYTPPMDDGEITISPPPAPQQKPLGPGDAAPDIDWNASNL